MAGQPGVVRGGHALVLPVVLTRGSGGLAEVRGPSEQRHGVGRRGPCDRVAGGRPTPMETQRGCGASGSRLATRRGETADETWQKRRDRYHPALGRDLGRRARPASDPARQAYPACQTARGAGRDLGDPAGLPTGQTNPRRGGDVGCLDGKAILTHHTWLWAAAKARSDTDCSSRLVPRRPLAHLSHLEWKSSDNLDSLC
jgi:hypothetical protein